MRDSINNISELQLIKNMYESKLQPLLPFSKFIKRFLIHIFISIILLIFSLLLGIGGYQYFEKLSWVDAFLNAAMLLGGMGPVDAPKTDAGKLFAGFYALYAGLIFLIGVSIILTPVLHRVMHKFHLAEEEDSN